MTGSLRANTVLVPISDADGLKLCVQGKVTTELTFEMEVPGFSAHIVFHGSPFPGDATAWSKRIMKALSDEFKPEREKENTK